MVFFISGLFFPPSGQKTLQSGVTLRSMVKKSLHTERFVFCLRFCSIEPVSSLFLHTEHGKSVTDGVGITVNKGHGNTPFWIYSGVLREDSL